MVEPVTRAHEDTDPFRPRRCRRREGFEGQKERCGEPRFATRGNTANPMIGSRAQHPCAVEEENRRGGEKPRGRHAGRVGYPPPKGDAETRPPGVGLFGFVRWRGDLWTTPGEEVRPAGRTARIGTRRESRRQGQEGRARTRLFVIMRARS